MLRRLVTGALALALALPFLPAAAAAAPTPGDGAIDRAIDGAATNAPDPGSYDSGRLLYVNEGNRLRRIDLDTIGTGALAQDVLVERASSDPVDGRDVNGAICAFNDGTGRFLLGEDTGQPSPPPGWGIFSADGTQVGKLTATYQPGANPEPFGCAFGPDGTLFTSDVGVQGFAAPTGQLTMWFPPYEGYPGPAGAYPDTDARSTNFCKLATDIGTAGEVAVDGEGRVYVASASGLQILRFSPPFPTGPDAAGGCGRTDSQGSPLADTVQREVFATADQATGMLTFSGLAIGPDTNLTPNGSLFAASVITGRIAEYDLDGTFRRTVVAPPESLPPISTGTPQGLDVGPDGTLYYADLDLVGTFPNLGPGPNGKVWRVRFDAEGEPRPPEVVREGLAFPDGVAVFPGNLEPTEWREYAGSPARRFFRAQDSAITAETVRRLRVKWRFPTGAIVTASPTVAAVDLPGEGRTQVVYVPGWDGNVYAIRLSDGSEVWRFATPEQPGAYFPGAASATVTRLAGRDAVIVPSGETVFALDAATGDELWRFEAGTGCVDENGAPPGLCSREGERNQVETSPLVVGSLVFFGMDVNDAPLGKGGFYALHLESGTLDWFFDLESGQTCRPLAGDEIRAYDGYHTEGELGLPDGFFASRPGCDHPRTRNGCGNVWSSPAHDPERGLLYFASSNCDTDDDPATSVPPAPMPPYDEAVVALRTDGTPAWRWRPREVDNADLAFGATPNLFRIERNGDPIDVLGIGNKDGTYYVLDRDGFNQTNGVGWDAADPSALPYWRTNVVPGGPAGGIIGTAGVDQDARRIHFSTAPGSNPLAPQQPTIHTLDLDTGDVLWNSVGATGALADASFAPMSTVRVPPVGPRTPLRPPDAVTFAGSITSPTLRAYDAATGDVLFAGNVAPTQAPSAIASGATVVDGHVVVGTGVGARGRPGGPSDLSSRIPSAVVALCVSGAAGCPAVAPGAPRGVAATGAALAATVTWDPPEDDGGSPVTGYTVTASPGGATESVGAEEYSARFDGLAAGETYTFSVQAENAIGPGAESTPSEPLTLATEFTDTARFTDTEWADLQAAALVLGLDATDVPAVGVAFTRFLAWLAGGDVDPVDAPPNTGPVEIPTTYPAAQHVPVEQVAELAVLTTDDLHKVGATLMVTLADLLVAAPPAQRARLEALVDGLAATAGI